MEYSQTERGDQDCDRAPRLLQARRAGTTPTPPGVNTHHEPTVEERLAQLEQRIAELEARPPERDASHARSARRSLPGSPRPSTTGQAPTRRRSGPAASASRSRRPRPDPCGSGSHANTADTVIGHAVRLHDLETALFGAFRVHEGDDGDEALAAIRAGTLTGISVQMTPLRSRDGRRRHPARAGLARPQSRSSRRPPTPPHASPTFATPSATNSQTPHPQPSSTNGNANGSTRNSARSPAQPSTRTPRSFRSDARYQAACRLREELAEEQRQLEPQVLRRGCGTILEIR